MDITSYPGTRIISIGDDDWHEPPEWVWDQLHQIAVHASGQDYLGCTLTYTRKGRSPKGGNYFTGRSHVPDGIVDDRGRLAIQHLWIDQYGREPEPEPKYTAVLLHEYTHLYAIQRGYRGHRSQFYRYLYGFAETVGLDMSVLEQWRIECRHIDRRARITASKVAAEDWELKQAMASLKRRAQRERRAGKRRSPQAGARGPG